MQFGTGLNTELTQKYERVKVQNDYVRPHIYKQISPIFNCVTHESGSLTSLAHQLIGTNICNVLEAHVIVMRLTTVTNTHRRVELTLGVLKTYIVPQKLFQHAPTKLCHGNGI